MKSLTISGSLRVNVGTKESKELRNQERVPCILYGGKEQIHFSAPEKEFKLLLYTPDVHIVKLNIEGKEYNAVLQEAQFNKINESLQHCDFLEIIPGKPVMMDIPVKINGIPEGVREGGRLLKKRRYIKVKALAENLPDEIKLDVKPLKIGQSIRVSDIKISNAQLMEAPNITIVAVKTTRVVEEQLPGAATPAAGAPAAGASAAATPAAAAPAAAGKKSEGKK